jgi:hypothetical protein
VARLQRELADAIERRRGLEKRLDDASAKLAKAREEVEAARAVADVRDSEGMRELDELMTRLERSERERLTALEGLEEARAMLQQIAGDLPGMPDPSGSADAEGALRQLRERITHLDAEADDREVLLRSLTAQLQERDDRIRALERLSSGAGEDSSDERALRERLLEMEERVARLSEELENARRRS